MCEIAISSQNNVFERTFIVHKNAIVTKFVSIIIIILYIYMFFKRLQLYYNVILHPAPEIYNCTYT